MISVKEHQEYLNQLYSRQNNQFSWDYMWGYLSRSSSYLFLAVDKGIASGYEFIKPLSWLLAIANKFEIDIEDAFLKRFPNICPYCLANPCVCVKTKKKPQPSDLIYAENIKDELVRRFNLYILENNQQPTFESFMEMIDEIYPQNEQIWRLSGINSLFHFKKLNEEIAEIHETICQHEKGSMSKRSIADEISDALAWLLSAWNIYSNKKSLTEEFALYFKDNCPICKQEICDCGSRKERNQGLFDVDFAYNILKVLGDLTQTEFELKARHYSDSIVRALESKTNYDIRTAVLQAKDFLNSVLLQNNFGKKL